MKKIFILFSIAITIGCAQAQNTESMNVAILVHENVQLLDFTGPAEVFADAQYNVYAVASSTNEITSQGFLKVRPNYSIDNCPQPDIIVIPGGDTDIPMQDPKVVAWVKSAGEKAQYVLSVCTGALLLSKAGLLDGKTATTHYCCFQGLESNPRIKVVKGKRFVDNGKVITTEGISAGIDGSLYVVSKIKGAEAAEGIAKYMMYDWRPKELDVLVVK